jgi:hypothetical protein
VHSRRDRVPVAPVFAPVRTTQRRPALTS